MFRDFTGSRAMPLQMIFEDVNGLPKPRMPRGGDGKIREPDGTTYLSLDQACARFQMDREKLEQLYRDWFSELLPEGDEPVTPEQSRIAAAQQDMINLLMYPHLLPDEYVWFAEQCTSRRLNPARPHIWPYLHINAQDGGRRTIELHTQIDTFRLIADRTNEYDGQDPPTWCGDDGAWRDIWTPKDQFPFASQIAVYRKRVSKPFYGIAYWEFYAPVKDVVRGKKMYPDCWERGGPHMLAKCAEALAFRKAFPEELSGLYTRDELEQMRSRPPERGMSVVDDQPTESHRAYDEGEGEGPQTQQQFELALIDLGFGNPVRRSEIMNQFKQQFRTLYVADKPAFYAKVLTTVRKNPRAYGVAVMLAAIS